VVFKRPPRLGFFPKDRRPEPNELVVRLDPSTGVRIVVDAKRADVAHPAPIELDMEFSQEGGEGPTPYEVLLHAAMRGDSTRFKRQDALEENWRVMQPLVESSNPAHSYQPGSWGPAQADAVAAGFGGWRTPWLTA
jgi:glucose-6-phosphate 1-dehydrogenase